MWLGLLLFYVGVVLCLNGLWMLGCIVDWEIWVINVFVGLVLLIIGLVLVFGFEFDVVFVKIGVFILLFVFIYLWVVINCFMGVDGWGLGWFSIFVVIMVVLVVIDLLIGVCIVIDWWMVVNWVVWAVLWVMFFMLLVGL